MGRILAFDFGTKRVGVAATDPLQIVASPLDTIANNQIYPWIREYVAREEVEAFVVGWPTQLDGSDTDGTEPARQFYATLRRQHPTIPAHKVDESFTTQQARQAMIDGGTTRKARRKDAGTIDKLSATLILQAYLQSLPQ